MTTNADSTTRSLIQSYIDDHPGVHFNELVRDLNVATGQAQYHIHRLLRASHIDERSLYGKTHYFPPTYSRWEQGALALARRETSREIVFYLLEHDEVPPADIVDDLHIARSTLEWHVSRLIDQDIAMKHRKSDGTVRLALVDRERIVELLSTVTPRAHDQLADRFMKFVDALFDY